ncbi:hypothetical protein CRG98_006384 [Punica granatum]|uniref:Uncharacterized protein n=1 Tax=Punica granatum TaxID=22663 RepID=A0A2I0KXP6_PUNGR|nr:hypothetical protein CRG98_006384 [Punica granatum]
MSFGQGRRVNDSAWDKKLIEMINTVHGGVTGERGRSTLLRMPEHGQTGFRGSRTFEAVHERLDLSLRSLRSLISPAAVVGVDVPTSFSPSCHCRCSRVFTAHSVQPSLPFPKATSQTLSSHPEATNGSNRPKRPPTIQGGSRRPLDLVLWKMAECSLTPPGSRKVSFVASESFLGI